MLRLSLASALIILSLLAVACGNHHDSSVAAASSELPASPLPGMPPVINPANIYSEAGLGKLADIVRKYPSRVYVPNSGSNTVDVIDPATFQVVDHFSVGRQPQHVVPSWDLKTLWILNDLNDSLTKLNPATGEKLETIPVRDPYNMYYTPDGKYAIVVAERDKRLDFYNAATMKREAQLTVPCRGVDHLDFSASGRYLIASCEFTGELVKVDVANRSVIGTLKLPVDMHPSNKAHKKRVHHGGGTMPIENDRMPQDVKTSPDGKVFFVADMMADGVHVIEPERFVYQDFIPTGKGAHGLYPSRDAKYLYVSNRDAGTVAVINFATRKVVQTWTIPGGGSPDMGGVSADGKILWLSGRYHKEVYAFDTSDGHLLARVPVGKGPHGLCVYPQPGRYSLGHTGVFR